FFAALASVLGALKAPADSIFLTYTGNPYTHTEGSLPRYTLAMSVSAEIELGSALPYSCISCFITPLAFTISDGKFTLSDSSPGIDTSQFIFSTDAVGDITSWNFNAQTIPYQPDYHLISSQNT